MKRYCEYSLAQLLYQLHSLEGGQAPTGVHSCHLSRLAEREGMHLTQLVAALLRWFDGYGFDTGHDYCNTLYVVGDATTVADGFVERLLRLFFLHVTADLREFDPRVLLAARKVVRLLHFPLVTTAAVFSNPFVNTLLRGEAVRLPEFGQPKIRTVGPYKCIVRLRQLPPLGALPTNARQHVILRFTTSEPCPFLHRELTTYLRRLQHHTRERPVPPLRKPLRLSLQRDPLGSRLRQLSRLPALPLRQRLSLFLSRLRDARRTTPSSCPRRPAAPPAPPCLSSAPRPNPSAPTPPTS